MLLGQTKSTNSTLELSTQLALKFLYESTSILRVKRMCIHCDTVTSPQKPSIEGLNFVVSAFVDEESIEEIDRRRASYKSHSVQFFQRFYDEGISLDEFPKDDLAAQIFFERKVRVRAVVATGDQHERLQSLADLFFGGHIGHAAGWFIHSGVRFQAEGGKIRQAVRVVTPKLLSRPAPVSTLPEGTYVPDRETLRSFREKLSLSQRQLAAEIGMSRGLLADIELGRKSHSSENLRFRVYTEMQKLANTMGIVL